MQLLRKNSDLLVSLKLSKKLRMSLSFFRTTILFNLDRKRFTEKIYLNFIFWGFYHSWWNTLYLICSDKEKLSDSCHINTTVKACLSLPFHCQKFKKCHVFHTFTTWQITLRHSYDSFKYWQCQMWQLSLFLTVKLQVCMYFTRFCNLTVKI